MRSTPSKRPPAGFAPPLIALVGVLLLALGGACRSDDLEPIPDTGGTGGGIRPSGKGGAGGMTVSPALTANATFSVQVSRSSAIPTVAIVEWSIDKPIDSAFIDFGRDPSNMEFKAPVDLDRPRFRTLLLGMKQYMTYFFRITAAGGGEVYLSDVYTADTDYLPNGIPTFKVKNQNRGALFADGGFTLNCTGLAGSMGIGGTVGKSWGFIFDKDGDVVWAFDFSNTPAKQCSRMRMSFDGLSMWAGNFANVSTSGALVRVPMDGIGTATFFSTPGRSHDFSVLPNGHILHPCQDNGGGYTNGKEGADSIKELDPDTGAVTTLYDEIADYATLIDSKGGAHTNHVTYVPELSAIAFSMRHIGTIGLISYPAGQLLATFGGPQTDFSAMSWVSQHGHDFRTSRLWVFSNNGSNGGADLLGFSYDLAKRTATQTFKYSSGISCLAFGDVKELPNGNLFATYSVTGAFQEVSATGTLLREITTSQAVGYSEHRASLYGPPPPYDR